MFGRDDDGKARYAAIDRRAIENLTKKTFQGTRADAAAWKIIDVLPAHPIITASVAAAATGRSKPQIYEALRLLQAAGVLVPLSESQRNRSWEAVGLLDLLTGLESGQLLDDAAEGA